MTKAKHTIFLSYSWADRNVADDIDRKFDNMPLSIMRDVRDLGDFERIKDYMKKIRENDYVVMIISEQYLKSKYCMYEILEMFKEINYCNRILPLIVPNANIFSPQTRADYIRFWKTEYTSLKKTIDEIDDTVATIALADDLKMYNNIYRDIDEIIAVIVDMKCPRTVDELFKSICGKLQLPSVEKGIPESTNTGTGTMFLEDDRTGTSSEINEIDRNNTVSIKVVGIGGGGNNVIHRMMESGVTGIEMIAVNTDSEALQKTRAPYKLLIGKNLTHGKGSGSDPAIGRKSMEENRKEMTNLLKGADIVFILAGMGGGTGTGAAPVVAEIARMMGILTIGIVTKPFYFEGQRRMKQAETGLEELRGYIDSLIVVHNERLKLATDEKITFATGFRIADDAIKQLVQSISEFNTKQLINLNFTDLRTLMRSAGHTYFGVGRASGDEKALAASKQAIQLPHLKADIYNAKGVIVTVAGNSNLNFGDVESAVDMVRNSVHHGATIIFGAVIDETLNDEVRVIIIATGLDEHEFLNDARLLPDPMAPAKAPPSVSADNDPLRFIRKYITEKKT